MSLEVTSLNVEKEVLNKKLLTTLKNLFYLVKHF